jgi:hypothetical protein
MPRNAERGRRTCRSRRRESESLGTDSRVLRRDGAVNAPTAARSAKFFSPGEFGFARAANAREGLREQGACA